MKKIFTLTFFVLASAGLMAQNSSDKELNTATAAAVSGTPADGKGNDRALFPVFLSGFVNLLGTDGKNDIVINPTLYSIWGGDPQLKNIQHYRTSTLLRNISLTAGFSPDTKNQLEADNGLWGLKWIIINNKVLHQSDYEDALATAKKAAEVNIYVHGLPNGPDVLKKYYNQPDSTNNLAKTKDTKELAIIEAVVKQFNVKKADAVDLINGSFGVMSALKKKLDTKSALNFAYNQVYDFQKWQSSKVVFSSDLSFFIGKIPFDITGSISFAADTTKKYSQLVRSVYEGDFGKNITFDCVDWLEVKPAVGYIRTDGPLYAKEKQDSFTASITPRLRINKNFWLPVTIKKDSKGYFGFFSVQYALK